MDRARRYAGGGLRYLVLAAVSALSLLPFLWVILSSLKSHEELYSKHLTFWPHRWTWDNYTQMFERMVGFGLYYRNSVLVSLGTVVLTLFTGSLAAYALSRFRFRGDRALLLLFLGTMICQKPSHQLHPSTRAASSSSCGTPVKTLCMMKMVSARLKAE